MSTNLIGSTYRYVSLTIQLNMCHILHIVKKMVKAIHFNLHIAFVYTELNEKTVLFQLFQMIQFSINT